jgi:acyl carrier protein
MSTLKMPTTTAPGPGFSQPDEIVRALTTFINTSIMARGRPVDADEDLEKAGIDSMALLKILLFIEAEFGFWMPDEDLVDANTASARALANYICQRRKPS